MKMKIIGYEYGTLHMDISINLYSWKRFVSKFHYSQKIFGANALEWDQYDLFPDVTNH